MVVFVPVLWLRGFVWGLACVWDSCPLGEAVPLWPCVSRCGTFWEESQGCVAWFVDHCVC